MKSNRQSKMAATLLSANKNVIISKPNDLKNNKYDEKVEMKSLSTVTAKAGSNPFAYLLRNEQKQKEENDSSDNIVKVCISLIKLTNE